jgi:hypothetical protein
MSKFKEFEVSFELHGVVSIRVIAEDADDALKEAEKQLDISIDDVNVDVLDILERELERTESDES